MTLSVLGQTVTVRRRANTDSVVLYPLILRL